MSKIPLCRICQKEVEHDYMTYCHKCANENRKAGDETE